MVVDNTSHNRRSFLKTTGTIAGAGLLAGCTGEDPEDGTADDADDDTDDDTNDDVNGDDEEIDFPEREIEFLEPYGAGGFDFYVRLVAKWIGEEGYLPEPIIVNNVEGAGGLIAMNQAYNADPDGYTNIIMNISSFSISQVVDPDTVEYDLREMTYYPSIAGTVRSVAVSTQTDITTATELVDAIRNDEVNIANQGPQTTSAINLKALGVVGGLFDLEKYENNSVTYEGRDQELRGLLAGDVQVMAGSFSSLLPYEQEGDIRTVLVYTEDEECPDGTENPDCTTFATTDLNINDPDGIRALSGGPYHRTFGGPPGVPEERANVLREAINQAIDTDGLRAEAEEAGRPITYADSETVAEDISNRIDFLEDNTDVLRDLGLMD